MSNLCKHERLAEFCEICTPKKIIDRAKLDELRKTETLHCHWGDEDGNCIYGDLLDTIDALLRVAEAAEDHLHDETRIQPSKDCEICEALAALKQPANEKQI